MSYWIAYRNEFDAEGPSVVKQVPKDSSWYPDMYPKKFSMEHIPYKRIEGHNYVMGIPAHSEFTLLEAFVVEEMGWDYPFLFACAHSREEVIKLINDEWERKFASKC